MKTSRRLVWKLHRSLCDVTRDQTTVAATNVVPTVNIHKGVLPFDDVPGPKGVHNIPLLGTFLFFKPFTKYDFSTMNRLLDSLHDTYGPIVRTNMGQPTIYVDDPAYIETVFRNEGKSPLRPMPDLHVTYSRNRNIIPGLASMKGEDWHHLRRAINVKLLKPSCPLHYLPIQNEVANDFVRILTTPNLNAQRLQDEFFNYAAESISAVTFNSRLGLLDDDVGSNPDKTKLAKEIRVIFTLLSKGFHTPATIFGFETRMLKDYTKAMDYIRGRVGILLGESLEGLSRQEAEGQRDPEEPNLLLSLLSSQRFSMAEIEMIMLDLVVSGTDSTAKNLQAFMYNMARNETAQDKLYEEIRSVMGTSGPLKEEHLPKMVYLKACLKESFRCIYPIQIGTGRYLPRDMILGGYQIPAGTLVVLNNQRLVQNEKYFDRADEFHPERWLRDEKGNREQAFPAMAFLPFGFGPRNCVGRRFAEQEIYLAAAKVLQNFRIELDPGERATEWHYHTFVTPKEPVPFKFVPRTTTPTRVRKSS